MNKPFQLESVLCTCDECQALYFHNDPSLTKQRSKNEFDFKSQLKQRSKAIDSVKLQGHLLCHYDGVQLPTKRCDLCGLPFKGNQSTLAELSR